MIRYFLDCLGNFGKIHLGNSYLAMGLGNGGLVGGGVQCNRGREITS